ncbi:GAF domain-containing protein [Nodosilinea sp. LEGE 07088]|nr:GAF domain-containing protein [Nodosilinea sp. LEGE 07088]
MSEILASTATEVQTFLRSDRVKVYRFAPDGSGEVVAESIRDNQLPSLLGHRFPAEDIPQEARDLFLTVRQRNIVNVAEQEIGISPLFSPAQQQRNHDIWFRQVDPCHVEYLTNMGVQSSLVVPVLYRHQLWGLLVAHHSQPRHIGPQDLEVVQLVADQVSVALAHAMVLKQSRLQAQHEATINRVVTLLHRAPAPALQAALNQTVTALQGLGGRLYLAASASGAQGQPLTAGPPPAIGFKCSSLVAGRAAPPLEHLPAWRAWLRTEASARPGEQIWVIDDLQQSQLPAALKSALQLEDMCGILVAQLTYRQQHLGYLSIFRQAITVETIWAGRLDSRDPRQQLPRQSFETWREQKHGQAHPWSENDIELAQTLAHHFAQVIYQGRLYAQVQGLNIALEGRVLQRTVELQQANTDLKREITERENTLHQLQLAKDSFKRLSHQNELILDSVGEGIYGIDLRGHVTFVNPAAAETLGYATDKVLGQFMHHLIAPTQPDGTPYGWKQSPVFKTLTDGTTHQVSGDCFRRRGDVYFPVDYTSTPIHENGKTLGAVILFKDITERQMVERLKDEFISVVSHELRTPLTSIRTALGLLVQNDLNVAPDKRRRMVEIAFSNTNRLVRLVNDLLDVERIKLGKVNLKKQACDLSELMCQSADEMRAMAEKNDIQLIISPLSIQLWVDRDRIIQTLANLLSNAIKFAPNGSTVKVLATLADVSPSDNNQDDSANNPPSLTSKPSSSSGGITQITAAVSQVVLIAVQDEGKGIPGDKLETIFDQFEQLNVSDNEHQGGTGLGLAICRSIVEQHGGKIWAESTLNQGSTFFFTLPIDGKRSLDQTGLPQLAD